MSIVYFLCGVPYSGKTKFAERMFSNHEYVHISSDSLAQKIATMCGEQVWYINDEISHFTERQTLRQIIRAVGKEQNVVIDEGNISRADRQIYLDCFPRIQYRRVIYVFPFPLWEVWEREDRSIEGQTKTCEERYHWYKSQFQVPTVEEGFDDVRHLYREELNELKSLTWSSNRAYSE